MSDALDLAEPARARAKHSSPEHSFQVRLKVWVRESVAAPHVFLAFDRSRAQSMFQHAREKARGVRAGTPDTVLMIGGRTLWCELKAPGNKPSVPQQEVGSDIIAAGCVWFWARSVEEYRQHLVRYHVPLHPSAALGAMHNDALVEGGTMQRGPARRPDRAAKPKPTPAQIRRFEANRCLSR